MARKTQIWSLLPWVGGLNTSLDPHLIPENQLVNAENVVTGVNVSKRKREGINKDWDDQTSGANAIIGGSDFWYYSGGSMLQKRVAIDASGALKSYDSSGAATSVTVSGVALSSPTIASMRTMNSMLMIATDGSSNRIKKWTGTGSATDLRSKWEHTTVSRASSGTTRTVVLGEGFYGVTGDYIVVTGLTESAGTYNGTWTVASVGTTSVTNDTITYTATGSVAEGTTADTGGEVNSLAPNGSILGLHQGRVLTNDKTKPYRLHYSQTGDTEIWGGIGDSGVIDFDIGDNDPEGITAIFPTFQGDLYVAKKTKLYRVRGLIPFHSIEKISDSIGCLSNEAVAAVDQSDVVWISEKGIHSLVTTDKYGDVEQTFLSKDIQKSFNGKGNYPWTQSRKKYFKVRYLPTQNLVVVGVTESNLSGTKNNSLWIMDTTNQQWVSRWPNVSCESLFVVNDSDDKRLYLGSSTTRIYKTFTGDNVDQDESGNDVSITLKVKTGFISPDKNPFTLKGFKKLILYYIPSGIQTINATVKVDNFQDQDLTYDDSTEGAVLGVDFILGSSVLAAEALFAPVSRAIDGYGRSIQIRFTESGQYGDYSLGGIGIEFQPAEIRHEVNRGTADG